MRCEMPSRFSNVSLAPVQAAVSSKTRTMAVPMVAGVDFFQVGYAWVGAKLLIEYGHAAGYVTFEVPKFISLGVIVVIFGAALAIAMIQERRKP